MPLKRASRGRTKGGKGSSGTIQCTNCGSTVPKDKAKKVTSRLNLVEHTLAKETTCTGRIHCITNCIEMVLYFMCNSLQDPEDQIRRQQKTTWKTTLELFFGK